MSVYNGEIFLKKSIESILKQTFHDFEFIIINDGSDDTSWEIITEYHNNDSRIVPITQKNIGLTKSLNKGLRLAKGKYIARQDADDLSNSNRFEIQANWFKNHSDGVLVGSWGKRIKQNGYYALKLKNNPVDNFKIGQHLKYKNTFNHSSVMFKKTVNNVQFLYNENINFSQDYELWSRLSHYGELGNINDYLVTLMKRNDSISNQKYFEQRQYALLIALSNNYPELTKYFSCSFNPETLINQLYSKNKFKAKIELLAYLYRIPLFSFRPKLKKIIFSSREEIFSNFTLFLPSIIRNSFYFN